MQGREQTATQYKGRELGSKSKRKTTRLRTCKGLGEKQKSENNRKNKSQSNKDQWWKRRLEKSIKEWWKDVSKLEEVKKGNKSSMLEKEHM